MSVELRPWLEIAEPRKDIADGSFDESLFAADLGMVAEGHGPADYLDPTTFTDKTYLTENLRAVLDELGRRLAGDPAAAGVYRLQTEFGGGKDSHHAGRVPPFRLTGVGRRDCTRSRGRGHAPGWHDSESAGCRA